MAANTLLHKLAALIGATMIVTGLVLGAWTLSRLPNLPGVGQRALAAVRAPSAATVPAAAQPAAQPVVDAPPPSPLAQPEISAAPPAPQPLVARLTPDLPADLISALGAAALTHTTVVTAIHTTPLTPLVTGSLPTPTLTFSWTDGSGEPIYQQLFAAATRFDTLDLNLRSLRIERAWAGENRFFTNVVVLSDTLPALTQILGDPGPSVIGVADVADVTAAVWATRNVLALLPFDQLVPELAVYAVDGQTPVENAAKFNPAAYPLVAILYAQTQPPATARDLTALLDLLPRTNRDPARLTVVAMTGVTAMVRLTAQAMDENGPAWPAEVVGPELAAADITIISNEVPFVADCETNTSPDNLVFCSKLEYLATLTASGADIIGLTGNHQNDYGLTHALASLEFYAEAGLPVYGGGINKTAAFAPYYTEHNGNRLAFIGANSYGPPSAWATDSSPGSAPFDLAIMSATIRSIKERQDADIVFAELQYQESYDTQPLYDQRLDFSALTRAGADVVTGVQSHVPQAVDFVDGRLVLHGLGNLYFDQMWREDTREGLIAKHTLYAGRHISTQLLPTLIYDYGQPRWPDAERAAAILTKVFAAGTRQ